MSPEDRAGAPDGNDVEKTRIREPAAGDETRITEGGEAGSDERRLAGRAGSADDETRIMGPGAERGSETVISGENSAADLGLGELSVGTQFARFLIESEIARGEMGVVYRARNLTLERTEALKVIAPRYAADPDFRARFRREAMNAAVADHPHVVRVYDAHEYDGRLYIAMQFVDGVDLRRRLARDPVLPAAVAVDITRQVASALDAAHANGLIHRDIKPSNILLAGTADHPVAYLSDFGVSRRAATPSDLTAPGSVVGTPYYTAPEQHLGHPVDRRADVYSLGCVLFEMLTGHKPYGGESVTAVALAHLQQQIPSVGEINDRLLARFDQVLAKAMAKDPDERYRSAGELADDAVAVIEGRPSSGGSTATSSSQSAPAEGDPVPAEGDSTFVLSPEKVTPESESTLVRSHGDEPADAEPKLVSPPTDVMTDAESARTARDPSRVSARVSGRRRSAHVLVGQLAALAGCLAVASLAYLAHSYVNYRNIGYVSLYRSAHGYPSPVTGVDFRNYIALLALAFVLIFLSLGFLDGYSRSSRQSWLSSLLGRRCASGSATTR